METAFTLFVVKIVSLSYVWSTIYLSSSTHVFSSQISIISVYTVKKCLYTILKNKNKKTPSLVIISSYKKWRENPQRVGGRA